MKIKPEHLAYMREAIKPFDTPERRKSYIERGLSSMRYKWDLLYAAGLSLWICDNLYEYLNDRHIDTAVNSIVPVLQEQTQMKEEQS